MCREIHGCMIIPISKGYAYGYVLTLINYYIQQLGQVRYYGKKGAG